MSTYRTLLISGFALALSGLPPARAELVGPVLPPGWGDSDRSRAPGFVGPPCPRIQLKIPAGGPASMEAAIPAEFARHPLSLVISDKLSGFDLEPPELREALLDAARDFVSVRDQRGSFPPRAAAVSRCLDDAGASPYCGLILRLAARHPGHRARRRRGLTRQERGIERKLKAGDLDGLSGIAEGPLLTAFKAVPDSEPLTALSDAALASKACPSTALLTALGQHVEQRMPEERSKDLAASLYRRGLDCGNDLHTVQAAYRLGLIRIWQGRYADAQDALSRISPDSPDAVDYRSRALYWRFYCAKKMNEVPLMTEMRSRLLREYPLSLHALLVGAGTRFGDTLSGPRANRDSETEFRSVVSPALNRVLRATEALLSLDESGSAAELLGMNLGLFKGVESSVQLYGAVLLMRAGDTIRKFQLLALMIHENPDSLTRPTLEMLYPIRRFDMVRSYRGSVDPWVVLSLIRQESAFNDHARSSVGAIGLMQLMPKTARRVASVSRHALFDPAVNIRVGIKYFSRLLDRFDGDVELALASYNAGSDKVDDWRKRYPTDNRLLFMDLMPYRETREYVASIARNYFWYLRLYGQDAFEKSFSGARNPASGRGFFVFSQFNPLRGPDLQTPGARVPPGASPAVSPVSSPDGSMRQTGTPGPGECFALSALSRIPARRDNQAAVAISSRL